MHWTLPPSIRQGGNTFKPHIQHSQMQGRPRKDHDKAYELVTGAMMVTSPVKGPLTTFTSMRNIKTKQKDWQDGSAGKAVQACCVSLMCEPGVQACCASLLCQLGVPACCGSLLWEPGV